MLTRDQAYKAMQDGNKVAHYYFASHEYYQLINGKIIAEDGVNHTSVFWSTDGNNFRSNGWDILN